MFINDSGQFGCDSWFRTAHLSNPPAQWLILADAEAVSKENRLALRYFKSIYCLRS